MTLQIQAVTPAPAYQLTPDTTVYTGVVELGRAGRTFIAPNASPEEFGLFVPDAPPLPEAAAEPAVLAEAYLMAELSIGGSGGGFKQGIHQVTASFLPDPRSGPQRWLSLTGTAYAPRPVRIGYRVTVRTA